MNKFKLIIILILCSSLCTADSGWVIFRKIRAAVPKSVATVSIENESLSSGVIYYSSLLPYLSQSMVYTFGEVGFVEDKLLGIIYCLPIKDKDGPSGLLIGAVVYDVGDEEIWWVNKEGEEKMVKYSLQKDLLAMISYGTEIFEKVTFGGTLKFANSSFADNEKSANSICCDFAITTLVEDFVISFAIQNFGFASKFLDTSEKLPINISFTCGTNKCVDKKNKVYVLPSVDIQYLIEDKKFYLSLGTGVKKSLLNIFLEYKFNIEEGKLTFGVGTNVKNFSIYYSFIPSSFLSSTHCISFCVKFK